MLSFASFVTKLISKNKQTKKGCLTTAESQTGVYHYVLRNGIYSTQLEAVNSTCNHPHTGVMIHSRQENLPIFKQTSLRIIYST